MMILKSRCDKQRALSSAHHGYNYHSSVLYALRNGYSLRPSYLLHAKCSLYELLRNKYLSCVPLEEPYTGCSSFRLRSRSHKYKTDLLKSFCVFPRIYANTTEVAHDTSNETFNENKKSELQSDCKETGWDRLAIMFAKTDSNNYSPEMEFVRNGVFLSFFVGGLLGGLKETKYTKENFIRRNMESTYVSRYAASRKFHDDFTKNFMKGALLGSLKTATFLGSYMTLVVATEVYLDRISIWEYFGAGVLTGSLFRFNYGLQGMVAGGFAGGMLGLTCGCCVVSILWMSGISYSDLKYWRHESWKEQLRIRDEKKQRSANGTIKTRLENVNL